MKLGVNIDHVATLRQARRGTQPDLILAAKEAEAGGAHSITIHLREDRRHIQDTDLPALKRACRVPINLELALVPEIIQIALALKPEKVCIVPERRLEVTTEGGLNVIAKEKNLKKIIPLFKAKDIEVSLFIDPNREQILKSSLVGADAIEIHTGSYSLAKGKQQIQELKKIREAALLGRELGLKVHAGHGLDYQNVKAIARIPEIEELNIGHSIVSQSIFWGMRKSVSEKIDEKVKEDRRWRKRIEGDRRRKFLYLFYLLLPFSTLFYPIRLCLSFPRLKRSGPLVPKLPTKVILGGFLF